MNRFQKIACFNLAVIAVSIAFSGGAVVIAALVAGFPKALCGLSFLGISGLMGFSPLFFRKKKGQVAFDERDEVIIRKAVFSCFICSYIFLAGVCIATSVIVGTSGTVSARMLPIMVVSGFIVGMLVQSIVTLREYGWGGKGEKS
ncbi:MAG: hypothetical protein JSV99_02355 [Planctomycetota bacterium]|nr:MAG: hypothetical protein JSV99_02355 [Planctomycetota bacterium]